ncbi:WD40 repeat-like protein [Mytilinidion resinicola]|uniref:WD40 repeat-like protein n=1 Tax=Mytilinidion resinicola TaxID=574789 RepID=A0A6A6Z302_9PEZI|nr:WD40 repeat-like protein [Mytilinidion resinicola]KAF2814627.1 WD40 repeat-like protein [Mytilinidion resinicola]
MRTVHLADNYLVVSHTTGGKGVEEFNVLDVRCQHNGLEICEHRRWLPVGCAWTFDCCGDTMAVGGEDGRVGVWDLKTGAKSLAFDGHTSEIKCVSFPDAETIISGATDGSLIVWDVPSGTRRHTLEEPCGTAYLKPITSLKSHDNLLVSGIGRGIVQIWDLNNGHSRGLQEGHDGCVVVSEFNADRSLLATGATGGEVKIWNVNSGACIASCLGHTRVVNQLTTDPDDAGLLISASADGWIRTWKWDTGASVHTFWAGDSSAGRNAICGVVWTKDLMITGAVNGLLRAWDRQTHQVRFDLRERQGEVYKFAAKGGLLAVVVWLENGKHLVELYNISELDHERSRFVNKNEDLSGSSLVMNLNLQNLVIAK